MFPACKTLLGAVLPGVLACGTHAPRSATPVRAALPEDTVNTYSAENTGPPFYRLTLYGRLAGRAWAGGRADSVVLLPDTPACVGALLEIVGRPPASRAVPVAPDDTFALTFQTARPDPCVRIAPVRAGQVGAAVVLRAGPLAIRYVGSPRAAEDSARVSPPPP